MTIPLSKLDIELLRTLGLQFGSTTAQVSRGLQYEYGGDNARLRSAGVRSWLMGLKRRGLVEFLDKEKPVCWKLTQAGADQFSSAMQK